jgi:hypothetical protein
MVILSQVILIWATVAVTLTPSIIAGYLTSMMEEMMLRYEVFAKHAPYMEKLSIDQNRVVIQDNKRNRIAEVLLKEGELQCLLDEKYDCAHVGFVYSLPELYNNEKVKAPPPEAYTDTELAGKKK